MTLPTASYLPRVVACPASFVLPQEREEKGRPAAQGTAIHAYLAAVGTKGREAALADVPEEFRDVCDAIPLERLPLNLAAEVTLAIDLETGAARELGRDLNRDYSAALPTEIVGTVDALGMNDDEVLIIDWKSGRGHVDPAARNWQLLALAVAAARVYGKSRARVGIGFVPEGSKPWFDWADLDALDLDAALYQLRKMARRIEKARADLAAGRTPETTPNVHCRYCPAWKSCPSQTALLRQVVAAPAEIEREVMTLLTPETARAAYERIKLVSAVVKRVEQAVYAWAATSPIDLGDGNVLGMTTTQKESVDGDKALPVLRAKFGDAVAEAACERSTSKAAINRALKKVERSKGTSFAEVERDALAALREAGAISIKTTETVQVHHVKEQA